MKSVHIGTIPEDTILELPKFSTSTDGLTLDVNNPYNHTFERMWMVDVVRTVISATEARVDPASLLDLSVLHEICHCCEDKLTLHSTNPGPESFNMAKWNLFLARILENDDLIRLYDIQLQYLKLYKYLVKGTVTISGKITIGGQTYDSV